MNEPHWVTKLKNKWNITTTRDFILIMLVFSLAGMAIGFERKIVFHLFGIDQDPMWVKVLVYVPLIVPIYQLNLLIFGFLLGQFEFFLEKEKRLVKFLFNKIRPS
jgi:hypothetical protein